MTHDSLLSLYASRIEAAIKSIKPDLNGQSVLTEAASGPYVVTAVLAAVAGAEHVIACTRDSQWGKADEIKRSTYELANYFGISGRIEVTTNKPEDMADGMDIVTNLGFVRPINSRLIKKLPSHAAISLMWEPWEFRSEDLDLYACQKQNIAIIATNERHQHVQTFKFVGMLALKLLLESKNEVFGLNILIVGSPPFGNVCAEFIGAVGGKVTLIIPNEDWPSKRDVEAFESSEVVIFVEHQYKSTLLGPLTSQLTEVIKSNGISLIHICGDIDGEFLLNKGIKKYPALSVPPGYMTVTTAYVGVKPVVDLHTAGLHVGSIVSRQRRNGGSIAESIEKAVSSGYGLALL